MKNKLTHDEIKQRQIEVLKYFKSVCDECGLRYSLAYGTLLGAVRHGGYIPWDDDIDVCMPCEDYERFIAEMKKRNDRFKLAHVDTHKTYIQSFSKLFDSETLVVKRDKKFKQTQNIGLAIDVFPLYYCPEDTQEFYKCLNEVVRIRKIRSYALAKGVQKRGNILKTLLVTIYKFFVTIPGYKYWIKREEKVIKKLNGSKSQLLCAWNVVISERERVNAEQFRDMGEIRFEDETYSCFADPHRFLSDRYGDYMQPPPENERVSPHDFDAYRIK